LVSRNWCDVLCHSCWTGRHERVILSFITCTAPLYLSTIP
jgi:hypothetical protein